MKPPRREAVAGTFYPGGFKELEYTVKKYLGNSSPVSKEKIKFLIVPHAGYIYSGQTAADAYSEIRDEAFQQIILLGPSHHFYFEGVAESGETSWRTPLGEFPVQMTKQETIIARSDYHRPEHSLEVQLPFLKHLLPDANITPILLGGPFSQAEQMAEQLVSLDHKNALWVISSDFNHVGPNFRYYPEDLGFSSGEEMDRQALEHVQSGEPESFHQFLQKTDATICGALPILVSLHMRKILKRSKYALKTYDCSGRQTGDTNSVGYASLFC